jgi:hypothetical protein
MSHLPISVRHACRACQVAQSRLSASLTHAALQPIVGAAYWPQAATCRRNARDALRINAPETAGAAGALAAAVE